MATRGSVRIGNVYYYIRSDAYPSFALHILKKAVRRAKSRRSFIRIANELAGFRWIDGRAPKKFINSPFEEHRYIVNLSKRTVKKAF